MLSTTKKDIPPGLVKIVRKEKISKKSLFLIGASALLIVIGFVTVFIYKQYLNPELKKSTEQPKIERTNSQVKIEESVAFSEPPNVSSLESSKNPETKLRAYTKAQSSKKQTIQDRKIPKPAEIPLEKFTPGTFKGADCLYRAYDFETRGSYTDAISEYKEYLKVTGKQEPKILNKIATLYLLVGSLTEASHYAELALQQAPYDTSVLINYGVIKAKLGDLSKAEECFRKVLSVNPENKTALYNLALLKEKKKEYEEALKLYEKLYQLGDPQAAEAIERIKAKQK